MSDWDGKERRKGQDLYIEELIQRAATKAADETMGRLSLDTPEKIEEFKKNNEFAGNLRTATEDTKKTIWRSIITVTVPAWLYLFWMAIKEAIR